MKKKISKFLSVGLFSLVGTVSTGGKLDVFAAESLTPSNKQARLAQACDTLLTKHKKTMLYSLFSHSKQDKGAKKLLQIFDSLTKRHKREMFGEIYNSENMRFILDFLYNQQKHNNAPPCKEVFKLLNKCNAKLIELGADDENYITKLVETRLILLCVSDNAVINKQIEEIKRNILGETEYNKLASHYKTFECNRLTFLSNILDGDFNCEKYEFQYSYREGRRKRKFDAESIKQSLSAVKLESILFDNDIKKVAEIFTNKLLLLLRKWSIKEGYAADEFNPLKPEFMTKIAIIATDKSGQQFIGLLGGIIDIFVSFMDKVSTYQYNEQHAYEEYFDITEYEDKNIQQILFELTVQINDIKTTEGLSNLFNKTLAEVTMFMFKHFFSQHNSLLFASYEDFIMYFFNKNGFNTYDKKNINTKDIIFMTTKSIIMNTFKLHCFGVVSFDSNTADDDIYDRFTKDRNVRQFTRLLLEYNMKIKVTDAELKTTNIPIFIMHAAVERSIKKEIDTIKSAVQDSGKTEKEKYDVISQHSVTLKEELLKRWCMRRVDDHALLSCYLFLVGCDISKHVHHTWFNMIKNLVDLSKKEELCCLDLLYNVALIEKEIGYSSDSLLLKRSFDFSDGKFFNKIEIDVQFCDGHLNIFDKKNKNSMFYIIYEDYYHADEDPSVFECSYDSSLINVLLNKKTNTKDEFADHFDKICIQYQKDKKTFALFAISIFNKMVSASTRDILFSNKEMKIAIHGVFCYIEKHNFGISVKDLLDVSNALCVKYDALDRYYLLDVEVCNFTYDYKDGDSNGLLKISYTDSSGEKDLCLF